MGDDMQDPRDPDDARREQSGDAPDVPAETDPIRLEPVPGSRRGFSVEDAYRVLSGLPPGPVDVSDAPARGDAADANEDRSDS
jgi:hypothetical protein